MECRCCRTHGQIVGKFSDDDDVSSPRSTQGATVLVNSFSQIGRIWHQTDCSSSASSSMDSDPSSATVVNSHTRKSVGDTRPPFKFQCPNVDVRHRFSIFTIHYLADEAWWIFFTLKSRDIPPAPPTKPSERTVQFSEFRRAISTVSIEEFIVQFDTKSRSVGNCHRGFPA